MRSLVVIAITLFGSVAIVAIVLLAIVAPGDTSTAIGHVLMIGTGVLTLLRSYANATKLREMHADINSRVDQLVTAEKSASHAEGVTEERERGK